MDELMGRLAEVADLERAAMLLAWDQEVCMPRAAAGERGEVRATIGRLAHERFVDDRVGELLEAAEPRDDVEADAVKVARRDYDKAKRVPSDLVAEVTRAAAGQRALVRTVLDAFGVDDEAWRMDEAVHPFASGITPSDIRLTTRYHDHDLESLFSSMHEFGHGLYERQVDPALARTLAGHGASAAWHESQSRLWENMVGRSAGFWRWCLPHAQAAFPGRLGGRTWQEGERAAHAVQ